MDLLKNKDTFYYEYLNSTRLKYRNRPIEYRMKMKCRDRVILPADNFVFLGDLDLYYNTTGLLRQNNITGNIFEYFIDKNNITLFEQPYLQLHYSIYNMNTMLSSINYIFDVVSDSIIDVLTGDKE